MKYILFILPLILLYIFRSKFGVILNKSIGTPFNINLTDTSNNKLPVSLRQPAIYSPINVNITGYTNGNINYTDPQGGSTLNQYPSGIYSGFFTRGLQTTGCINQYDATQRGITLPNLIKGVCTANRYTNGTIKNSCTGNGGVTWTFQVAILVPGLVLTTLSTTTPMV